MKERPILFSGPMVRAILNGRKTQTRRVVKPQPEVIVSEVNERGTSRIHVVWKDHIHRAAGGRAVTLQNLWESWADERNPYGRSALYQVPPDRLWVKETWAAAREYDHLAPSEIPAEGRSRLHYLADGPKPEWAGKTRVSIHMPRWASRLTPVISSVRMERLQDISETDAGAEGAHVWAMETDQRIKKACRATRALNPDAGVVSRRGEFRALWDSINGDTYPWDSNPWLWVVEFRRMEVEP